MYYTLELFLRLANYFSDSKTAQVFIPASSRHTQCLQHFMLLLQSSGNSCLLFFLFFHVSFSIVRCLQRFSSPAGHFDCLSKLAPRRQLKNCDLLPLETNFLHANDIIRYIYMLFSLLLSSFWHSPLSLHRRHCNSIVKVVRRFH